MVRQDHDRDHLERLRMSRRPERCAQIIDMIDQQAPPAFQQIHGEEECAARHMFAAITRHTPACQRHQARNIGKSRTQRRHSPQRMPRSPKVRQGAPYNKILGSLGRAPARRLYELQAFVRVTGLCTSYRPLYELQAFPEGAPGRTLQEILKFRARPGAPLARVTGLCTSYRPFRAQRCASRHAKECSR
jgi:hypothetical protein